jgi:hypothetical protein
MFRSLVEATGIEGLRLKLDPLPSWRKTPPGSIYFRVKVNKINVSRFRRRGGREKKNRAKPLKKPLAFNSDLEVNGKEEERRRYSVFCFNLF